MRKLIIACVACAGLACAGSSVTESREPVHGSAPASVDAGAAQPVESVDAAVAPAPAVAVTPPVTEPKVEEPPPPRHHPPIEARVVQVIRSGGGVLVVLNRGTKRGIAVGSKGWLTDSTGAKIAGSDLTVIEAKSFRSRASVALPERTVRERGRNARLLPL